MYNKTIYALLLFFLLNLSCKKDAPIGINQTTNEISTTHWLKTSNNIFKSQIFDFKKLNDSTIALLANDYLVVDSNFNIRYSDQQFQLMNDYKAKNLTNPFYTNSANIEKGKQYLISNYFDAVTGRILSKSIIEPSDFINVSTNGYGILLDYGIDKVVNKWIKLFLKTEFDTTTSIGKKYSVLVGFDMKTTRKTFEKVFENNFNRVISNKKGYLLYHENAKLIRFLDPGLGVLDTSIFQSSPTSVFATDNMFYIQTSYGFFSTENGQQFTWVDYSFTAKRLLSNNLMYGVKEHKPCILNLSDGTTAFLPTRGLEPNTYIKDCEAIAIDNKIILFTNNGVFQIRSHSSELF
jgi:hypothetical protein